MCCAPAPFKTLLAKFLAVGSLEATFQQIQDFGMELYFLPNYENIEKMGVSCTEAGYIQLGE